MLLRCVHKEVDLLVREVHFDAAFLAVVACIFQHGGCVLLIILLVKRADGPDLVVLVCVVIAGLNAF